MRNKKTLKYTWQIEEQQEFDEKPFEALVAKLTRQKKASERKYRQLTKAVTTAKTIITSEGNKLVIVPKSSATRPSSKTTGAASNSSVPLNTVKVIVGKKTNPKV